jgi:hypothetical protein
MTIEITELKAPTIELTGTRVFSDGSTESFTNLVVDQSTPQGSPTEITNTFEYIFSGNVKVTFVPPAGVTLFDYSGETEDTTNFIGMKQDKSDLTLSSQCRGNVLFFFGEKIPSPNQANVYIGQFRIVSNPLVDHGVFAGRTYMISDDTIVCSACVFFEGKVGQVARFKIKIV